MEKDCAYQFMAGLNLEFNQDKVQITENKKLSLLNEVISIITTEESRRKVILESHSNKSLICFPKTLNHFF